MMDCNDVTVWLRRDLDGAAEPSSEIAEHLERCTKCTAEAERLKETADAARAALPQASVPIDFVDSVMGQVAEPTGDAALAEAVKPRRPILFFAGLAAMAALILLALPLFDTDEEDGLAGPGDGALTFHLTNKGELKYAGAAISLDRLGAILNAEAKRSGFEEVEEARPSKLTVLLRMDRGAVWRHAQWFMILCAEERVRKTHFALEKGPVFEALLPMDKGLGAEEELKQQILIAIRINPRGSRQVAWGPKRFRQLVTMPTSVEYAFGDRVVADTAFAGQWIAEAKAAAAKTKYEVVGEIRAGGTVPVEHVLGLLEHFHKAGIKQVAFYSTVVPNAALRRKPYLPYPTPRGGRNQIDELVRQTKDLADALRVALDANQLDRVAEIRRRLDEVARRLERVRAAGSGVRDRFEDEEEILEEAIVDEVITDADAPFVKGTRTKAKPRDRLKALRKQHAAALSAAYAALDKAFKTKDAAAQRRASDELERLNRLASLLNELEVIRREREKLKPDPKQVKSLEDRIRDVEAELVEELKPKNPPDK